MSFYICFMEETDEEFWARIEKRDLKLRRETRVVYVLVSLLICIGLFYLYKAIFG